MFPVTSVIGSTKRSALSVISEAPSSSPDVTSFISHRRLALDRRATFSRSSSIASRLQSQSAQESCVPRVASEVVKLLLPCNKRQRTSALLKIPFEPRERPLF